MLNASKLFAAVLITAATTIAAGCATSPDGRHQLMFASEKVVDAQGVKQFERIKRREFIVTDEADNKLVNCVVRELSKQTPGHDWEAVIFQSDEANAFALPGNKIGVNSGLLRVAVNEDQLAAVIGHEMGHVLAQHGRERMSQQIGVNTFSFVSNVMTRSKVTALTSALAAGAQLGILYPFSQTQENEADIIGLRLLASAGFRPSEAVQFWKNMDVYVPPHDDELLSGHPTNASRVENLTQHLNEAASLAGPARPACDL